MIDAYKVYVTVDKNNCITEINSNAFLSSLDGWIEIDSGYGERYHHAQGNYFPQPIWTETGAYRYKLMDGKPMECTAEEITGQIQENRNPVPQTVEERIGLLEKNTSEMKNQLSMLLRKDMQ